MSHIVLEGISKIFGQKQAEAADLIRQGKRKAEVAAACGAVVGLCDISFEIVEGEILTLMGLSGSGKSTLLRCMNRLVEPTCGSIRVGGVDVTASPPDTRASGRGRMRDPGFVAQDVVIRCGICLQT